MVFPLIVIAPCLLPLKNNLHIHIATYLLLSHDEGAEISATHHQQDASHCNDCLNQDQHLLVTFRCPVKVVVSIRQCWACRGASALSLRNRQPLEVHKLRTHLHRWLMGPPLPSKGMHNRLLGWHPTSSRSLLRSLRR